MHFWQESTNANSSNACNFYGRGDINSTCPLRDGPQKVLISKTKKIWIEKPKVTNP